MHITKRNEKTATIAVYIVLMRGSSVLLARRANTGYMDGKWALPSGHMEEHEVPRESAIREAREELGVVISPDHLEFIHVSYRPEHDETGDRVDFYFRTWRWDGEPQNCEPEKCSEVRWFRPFEFPPESEWMPHVFFALNHRHCVFSELGVSWLQERGLWQ
jgi:ADP-ribose pyrophosphatase YjhB (NUDIX family)